MPATARAGPLKAGGDEREGEETTRRAAPREKGRAKVRPEPEHNDAFSAQGPHAGTPAGTFPGPLKAGGEEREGKETTSRAALRKKKDGLKSALRVIKFVVFCARRSAPCVSKPESELLSLLDS